MKKILILVSAVVLTVGAGSMQAAVKPKPALSRADAEKIALEKEPGTIKAGELEKEHGKWIYSFDVQTSTTLHEVNVDANTGKIVEDSVETPAAEAKEKKQDAAKPKM